MTIRKGEGWGRRAPLPPDGVVVHSDAEARAIVLAALGEDRPVPTMGLLGGDLCRTLGGLGDVGRLHSDEAMTFPIDLGHATIDGRSDLFVAHLIARRSWWHGRTVAVMNAQWLGDWDLGPRSHPNDGLLDATDGDLALGDRWTARRRARTGSHLPHPALRTVRSRSMSFDFAPSLDVRLDGVAVGRAAHLEVSVQPDALTVVV